MGMYKFDYQHQEIVEKPYVTCIVPAEWLALDLPVIGGAVSYRKEVEQGGNPGLVFEFAEVQEARNSGGICDLKVHLPAGLGMAHDVSPGDHAPTITIRLPAVPAKKDDRPSPELVLINHLFCLFAGSAFTGASWLDISDLLRWLTQQTELVLECEIGSDPKAMLENLLARQGEGRLASSYAVIFGNEASMKMEHLNQIQGELRAAIAYAPAVVQEQFLISALLSDREFVDEMG